MINNSSFNNNLPELKDSYSISNQQIDNFWNDGFIYLRDVLTRDEIEVYREIIRETANIRFKKNEFKPSSEGAFLQTLNLRFDSPQMSQFCLSRRLGEITARLLKVESVRIFHEQALFKQPGGNETMWHQDQYYWPLETNLAIGMWMPIVDCESNMGTIRFVKGSHKYGDLKGASIGKDSKFFFDSFIKKEKLEIIEFESCKAGDCTFHFGWTVHGAKQNLSDLVREAMVITYFANGTRVGKLDNPSRINDAKVFLGGKMTGELADNEINTVVFKKSF